MFRILLSLLIASTVAGCSTVQSFGFGKTYAEQQAGYSYIPVEPTSVSIHCLGLPGIGNNCKQVSKSALLDALPDNSVRIATRLVSGKADIGIPVFGTDLGYEGNTYEVIIDFVNTQTVNKQFLGKWYVSIPDNIINLNRCYPFEKSVLEIAPLDRYENWTLRASLIKPEEYLIESRYQTKRNEFEAFEKSRPENRKVNVRCSGMVEKTNAYEDDIQISPEVFNIPVYIGIGLRLKANVTVLKGQVNLSSLPALTAAVSAGAATGTMSVQTIGISGKSARSNLLLLDKIDSTTIQNAIQVLASIKSSIESEDTTITPRIVGFHNTIGSGAQGVNLIHSLLASDTNSSLIIDSSSHAKGPAGKDSNSNNGD